MTLMGVIGTNDMPNLNLSGLVLVDLQAENSVPYCQSLSIMMSTINFDEMHMYIYYWCTL